MNFNITDFPDHVWIHICSYLGKDDLKTLMIVNKRLNQIVTHLPVNLYKTHLATCQINPIVRDRSFSILSCLERFRIEENWREGKYTQRSFLYEKTKYIPWLHLTKTHVWLSRGSFIRAYRRNQKKINDRPSMTLHNHLRAEISRFAKNNLGIVAGLRDGHIWVWSKSKCSLKTSIDVHKMEVHSVDVCGQNIISGARDGEFYIWTATDDFSDFAFRSMGMVNERIWAAAFNATGSHVAVGTAAVRNNFPMHIYDVNSTDDPLLTYGKDFPSGCGVLSLKWLDNQKVVTGGYDSKIRLYDIRTSEPVKSWEDPFNSVIYSLDTDGRNTLISGTQLYGCCVLYDLRMKYCIQMYYMKGCTKMRNTSPVYCLSYEPQQLVAVTDRHLHVMDFSDSSVEPQSYARKSQNSYGYDTCRY